MSLRERLRANRRRLIGGAVMSAAGVGLFPAAGDSGWRWPLYLVGGIGLSWLALAGEDLIWGGRRG